MSASLGAFEVVPEGRREAKGEGVWMRRHCREVCLD